MEKTQIQNLSNLKIELNPDQVEKIDKYKELFLDFNSKVNLISKNDEKFLFEKHIFDSLAINLFFQKKNLKGKSLLDIGTGGGFPSVPIALFYPQLQVYALDSIKKKINVIDGLKSELKLENLFPTCTRVENIKNETIPNEYDFITSRAVAKMDLILKYSLPYLKKGGIFIAYKSKKALDEIKEAKSTLKRMNAEIVDIIDYTLPLDEIFERNLIIVQKK